MFGGYPAADVINNSEFTWSAYWAIVVEELLYVGSIFMKTIVCALVISLALSDITTAQLSCQQTGDFTYCDNGQTFQRNGNFTYDNQGHSWQNNGSFTYGSDGTTYQHNGNFTYDNNGNTWQRNGNFTYGNDGSACQQVGAFTYCD